METAVYQCTMPDGTVEESPKLDYEPLYVTALFSHRNHRWLVRTWTARIEHAERMEATLANIYGRPRVALLTVDGHEEGE